MMWICLQAKFPLYDQQYGAEFLAGEKGLNPRWEVRDRRLEDLALLREKTTVVNLTKVNPAEFRRLVDSYAQT